MLDWLFGPRVKKISTLQLEQDDLRNRSGKFLGMSEHLLNSGDLHSGIYKYSITKFISNTWQNSER